MATNEIKTNEINCPENTFYALYHENTMYLKSLASSILHNQKKANHHIEVVRKNASIQLEKDLIIYDEKINFMRGVIYFYALTSETAPNSSDKIFFSFLNEINFSLVYPI